MRRRYLQWSGARSAGAGRWAFGILWHPHMYVLSGIFGVPFVLLSPLGPYWNLRARGTACPSVNWTEVSVAIVLNLGCQVCGADSVAELMGGGKEQRRGSAYERYARC